MLKFRNDSVAQLVCQEIGPSKQKTRLMVHETRRLLHTTRFFGLFVFGTREQKQVLATRMNKRGVQDDI